MPKRPLALMAIAALLAACSAAAQKADALAQTAVEPALFGAPSAEPAAPEAERAAIAAARLTATYDNADDNAAVSCVVRGRRTANGLLMQGRAFADRDVDGEYDLVITKSGGGGSSEINQAGPLSIAAGSSVTLGESEIGVERGARVRAVLTLRDANGEICRRTFTL